MNNIKKLSQIFKILFQILFCLTPITMLWFWLTARTSFDAFVSLGFSSILSYASLHVITWDVRILAILVSCIPTGIVMFVLYQLIKLFKQYEIGNIFSIENARRYRKLGFSLFAWVIGGVIYDALLSVVLTLHNPPHHHAVSAHINGTDILALIVGGIVILIAHIMKEGYKLVEEQELTI